MAIYDSLTRPQIGLRHGVRRALSDGIGRLWLPHFIDGLRTAQDWSDLIGISPDHLWLMEAASGTVPDEIGSLDLDEDGAVSPSYQAATGWPRVGISSDVDTDTTLQGGPSDYLDLSGSTSWGGALFVRLAAGSETSIYAFMGEGGASTPRWRIAYRPYDQQFFMRANDGTNSIAEGVTETTAPGRLLPLVFDFDRDAGLAKLKTPGGAISADISSFAVDMTASGGPFRLFRSATLSPSITIVAATLWLGSKAEGNDHAAIITELSRGLP